MARNTTAAFEHQLEAVIAFLYKNLGEKPPAQIKWELPAHRAAIQYKRENLQWISQIDRYSYARFFEEERREAYPFNEDKAYISFLNEIKTYKKNYISADANRKKEMEQEVDNALLILTTLGPYLSDAFVLCQFLSGGQIELNISEEAARNLYDTLYDHSSAGAAPRYSSHGKTAVPERTEAAFSRNRYRSGGRYHAEITAGSLIPNILFWLDNASPEKKVVFRFQAEKFSEYANAAQYRDHGIVGRLCAQMLDKICTFCALKSEIAAAYHEKHGKYPTLSFKHFMTFAEYLWTGKQNIGPHGHTSLFNDHMRLQVKPSF